MGKYSGDELSDALQVVSSTISKCEKQQPKFVEGTSQYTLLKHYRTKAFGIFGFLFEKVEKFIATSGLKVKEHDVL